MGSAGIKRRKRRRPADTPAEAPVSEGDVNRLFGRFTWNQYSPAGNLERNGFLWRQLGRRKRDGWSIVAYVVFAIFTLPFVIGFVALIIGLLRHL